MSKPWAYLCPHEVRLWLLFRSEGIGQHLGALAWADEPFRFLSSTLTTLFLLHELPKWESFQLSVAIVCKGKSLIRTEIPPVSPSGPGD